MVEVYPVVHAIDTAQAVEQALLAHEHGADGVFVIAHGAHESAQRVVGYYNAVREALPSAYVGVNFLQLGSGHDAFLKLLVSKNAGEIDVLPSAVWVDEGLKNRHDLAKLRDENPVLKTVQYLGGAAFKGTGENYTDDPEEAARRAQILLPYVDVVTTSGQGTGYPPSPEKIKAMKAAIGDAPLAVASGIDAHNYWLYVGAVDKILVASSVETKRYSGEFDTKKLGEFIALVHEG